MTKRKVALLFGGASVEHAVSIQSARSVFRAIDPERYTVLPVAIARDGTWLSPEASWALLRGADVPAAGPAGGPKTDPPASPGFPPGPPWRAVGSPHLNAADVAFPLLHGPMGEDGTVQGYLELLGIPYVGSGVLASAVGMDKATMKRLFALEGLPQVRYLVFERRAVQADPDAVARTVEEAFPYPVFVKPANSGSSLGISRADDRSTLVRALQEAARYDATVLVEEGLAVRELEVAVLGNEPPEASVVGEVVPRRAFYDYEAKYTAGGAELLVPAPIDGALAEEIRALALRAYRAIGARDLARVDFFLDKGAERLYVNEINTMPGFTDRSMYPRLWAASGLAYPALIDRLVEEALRRAGERNDRR
ncbi:D-alanine--D-alanine ligase family protein [Hydrogenibacillus sp. N12]|uniref:D-alanine--D-alanine ligase family protein n=1 Tax=Hydrogenibacillus sp. N12 TaxID=2866627 RepID=UPI001C7CC3ED|nr:D-alanine--D-alanine ligase family protein [Hydrogenibacillus sp. N12]QZA33365.1 D-alanine--D-alanine ligase [Hydrogenibacillus sp. N12]